MDNFATDYGYFNATENEYVILRPDTPRPWVNVICPGDYGLVVSQTGGGYSWRTNASYNRITRWEQDMIRDDWGKYLYVRDDDTGQIWPLTWKPVCGNPGSYQIAHGIGYSRFMAENLEIRSQLTMFVPPEEPVEIWHVELRNESARARNLSLFSYLEWALGKAPDSHREFHKTFIETSFDERLATIWATKRLWEVANKKGQHWNRNWEYVAFHSVSQAVSGYEADKESFLGMYGSLREPFAVRQGALGNTSGRWGDAIGSLHNRIKLEPGECAEIGYLLGAVKSDEQPQAERVIAKYQNHQAIRQARARTTAFWRRLLTTTEVDTPDHGLNLMMNTWLKYQALSCHMWGRTAYYQTGGAYGFRDQLQASQIFLAIDPEKTANQIKLHAAHQFPAGRVNHWWHPLADVECENKISDNLLWLPFVTVKYLKETGCFNLLEQSVPYRGGEEATIYEHCCQAIEYSLSQRSARGLPLIGDGDWNDGLNAVGTEGKGESIWLGHFLYGVLMDFAVVAVKTGDQERASRYQTEAAALKESINRHGWDGDWYLRATQDDGTLVGSRKCATGRIFLNAQTWAILNEVADETRAQTVFVACEENLFRQYGPLLLYPAYQEPDPGIGYLSRYAPGVRENGGVYTHAAAWAVLAACKLGHSQRAWELLKSFLAPYRSLDPDLYKAEPYVTPGNVDGPDSPHFGRGGWTWYTGSATWTFLAAMEGILGIQADWDGLRINPSLPKEWDRFSLRRPYHGAVYLITCVRSETIECAQEIYVDNVPIKGNTILPHSDGGTREVRVLLKKATQSC